MSAGSITTRSNLFTDQPLTAVVLPCEASDQVTDSSCGNLADSVVDSDTTRSNLLLHQPRTAFVLPCGASDDIAVSSCGTLDVAAVPGGANPFPHRRLGLGLGDTGSPRHGHAESDVMKAPDTYQHTSTPAFSSSCLDRFPISRPLLSNVAVGNDSRTFDYSQLADSSEAISPLGLHLAVQPDSSVRIAQSRIGGGDSGEGSAETSDYLPVVESGRADDLVTGDRHLSAYIGADAIEAAHGPEEPSREERKIEWLRTSTRVPIMLARQRAMTEEGNRAAQPLPEHPSPPRPVTPRPSLSLPVANIPRKRRGSRR